MEANKKITLCECINCNHVELAINAWYYNCSKCGNTIYTSKRSPTIEEIRSNKIIDMKISDGILRVKSLLQKRVLHHAE